ncbi:MAG: thiamine pyrophosphate-binding protein [Vampirovibrionales bacterium]|nr:thiamine pyrophosphate-binding protein [Vampirovibrionales bacterium]
MTFQYSMALPESCSADAAPKIATIKGKDAFCQQLIADGINLVFGNPGTVEEALLETLPKYPEIRYIMGLQEAAVTAMADAYARATQRPAFVQVHASVGLGNAMGLLYQAKQCHTPLVMYAGETYADLLDFYGFLGGNTVELARPVTKWADRVSHPSQLLRNLRRAIKIAMTPPQGPVFLAIPMNVLDAEIPADIHPSTLVNWQVAPDAPTIQKMADILLEAERPMLLAGDQVSLTCAQPVLHRLSHLLGAAIYGCDFANLNADFRDPLFMGLTSFIYSDQTVTITHQSDAVLAVGGSLFRELFPTHSPYFAQGAKLMQIDLNDWELGKNFPADIAVHADPRLTLEALCAVIEQRLAQNPALKAKAEANATFWQYKKIAERDARSQAFSQEQASAQAGIMPPSQAMAALVEALPQDVVIFDESISAIYTLLHYLEPTPGQTEAGEPDYRRYFMARGGCLGVGLAGAIGLKLAMPDKPVLCISGDGAALYTCQALWTAAHEKLPIVWVIVNNQSYQILKHNLKEYWKRVALPEQPFSFMDMRNPAIDFVSLAQGFGVKASRVTTPEELKAALTQAFSANEPVLIDVAVSSPFDDASGTACA